MLPFVCLGIFMLTAYIIEIIAYDVKVETGYNQVIFDDTLELSIAITPERNYLYHIESGEEVQYMNFYREKPFYSKLMHPIYIDEIESFYIVIFSYDKDKTITNNRFLQNDYERHHQRDILFLIDKSNGFIISAEDYEQIGYEIDLTSFQEGNNLITYGVFLLHEKGIAYIRCINIDSDITYDTYHNYINNIHNSIMWVNSSIGVYHSHTLGDPSEIEAFILEGAFYYYEDSYGVAFAGRVSEQEYGVMFRADVILTDESNAIAGYVRVTNSGIYYISNDMNLMFTNGITTTLYQEDVNFEDWESYISE